MTTIDQIIAEKLNSLMIDDTWPIGNFILCVIAVLLCTVLCRAIGLERERRGRNAGLRTHLLVGIGSCLIMIISIYGFPHIVINNEFFSRDVARLAAGVITGVGFLGAGAIIHRNSSAKGLTTAATIWLVMAIGLACGSMNFVLATGTTVLILAVLVVLRRFEKKLVKTAALVRLEIDNKHPIIGGLLELSQQSGCTVQDMRIEKIDNDKTEISFFASPSVPEFDLNAYLAQLEKTEGVLQVEIVSNHK